MRVYIKRNTKAQVDFFAPAINSGDFNINVNWLPYIPDITPISDTKIKYVMKTDNKILNLSAYQYTSDVTFSLPSSQITYENLNYLKDKYITEEVSFYNSFTNMKNPITSIGFTGSAENLEFNNYTNIDKLNSIDALSTAIPDCMFIIPTTSEKFELELLHVYLNRKFDAKINTENIIWPTKDSAGSVVTVELLYPDEYFIEYTKDPSANEFKKSRTFDSLYSINLEVDDEGFYTKDYLLTTFVQKNKLSFSVQICTR